MQFEVLSETHLLEQFNCGSEYLNRFLIERAVSDNERKLNKTFVATPDGQTVIGFVTVAYGTVVGSELPKDTVDKSRRNRSYAVMLVGQLGVDVGHREQGIGENLIYYAFNRARAADDCAALHGMIVDAWEAAQGFYDKMGFAVLPGAEWTDQRTIKMYIPMKNIRQFLNTAANQ